MPNTLELLIACAKCLTLVSPAELWQGGHCEACTLRADPFACPACKARGTVYVPAMDDRGRLIRQLAVCGSCGGEG